MDSEDKLIDSETMPPNLRRKISLLCKELKSLKEKNLENASDSDVNCPVCGSTEHPYLDADSASQSQKDDEADYDEALLILEQKRSKTKNNVFERAGTFWQTSKNCHRYKKQTANRGVLYREEKSGFGEFIKDIGGEVQPFIVQLFPMSKLGIRLSPRQYELDTIYFPKNCLKNYDYIKTENRNKLLQSLRNVEVAKVLRK